MGGVILDMGPSGGLPFGEHDTLGRADLVEHAGIRHQDLEQLVFEPWSHGYARRRELGREESFWPHLERLTEGCGIPAAELFRLYFEPYSRWLRGLPGAVGAVASIAGAGYRLGIVSNVPMPGIGYRWALERLGVADCFSDLRFSHDEGSRKPAAEMLSRSLAALGVEAAEAVMVGDRRREDVGSGRALGCATVWLESRYDDGPEADATIPDLAALPALLQHWRGDGPTT